MVSAVVKLAALLAVALDQTSLAAPPHRFVRFSYERGSGTSSCPDEAAVRGAVAERLGYDPFAGDAPESVVVKLKRTDRGLRAEVEIRDRSGHATGARSLDSASARNDCTELASALALAVALAIDPLLIARPPPEPACPPPPRVPSPRTGEGCA